MKSFRLNDRIPVLLCVFLLVFSGLHAQTTKIMTLGNSITWGKLLRENPTVSGTHGYRDHLYNALVGANADINFVGPWPGNPYYDAQHHDPPYEGYFRDGRRIGHFLPDSTWNLQAMLNAMPLDSLPDFVIVHLGTNDMVTSAPIGDWQTPGTVTYRMYRILQILLDYNRGGHTIQHIFLCNIIPKAEDASRGITFPEVNSRIESYNAQLRTMYDDHPTWSSDVGNERVVWVDTYTRFKTFMSTYYSLISADVDPTHPNTTGYTALGSQILFEKVYFYIDQGASDNFDRAAGGLNNNNRWRTTTTIQLSGMTGQTYDGTIYCNAPDPPSGTPWNNLAVWPMTENANSINMTFHADTDPAKFSTIGMAIALDDTVPSQADGYLVWITGSQLRVFSVVSGQSGNSALPTSSVTVSQQYVPGDNFKVIFREDVERNSFDIFINGTQITTVYHNHHGSWAPRSRMYAGVLFKGGSGVPSSGHAAMITDFQAQTGSVDPIAPAPITYFEAIDADYNSVTLYWDATGDDGTNGTASRYDLRMSTTPFSNPSDYNMAEVVPGLGQPLPAGTREAFKVRGLNSGTRYYFVIRAIDDWGNIGYWSTPDDIRTEIPAQEWDHFADLNEWSLNTGDYGIDNRPGMIGELTNINSTQNWPGSIAVYKGRKNPSTVSMVWGNEATYGAPAAIENGGAAVMLNSDQPNADGYVVFIRTVQKAIYLYSLSNGGTGSLIDAVPYVIKDNLGNPKYPDADDTLKVVIDWENSNYNRFDVYVNSVTAGERALYDNTKLHSGSGNKYAGVFLSGLYAIPGRNNNVFAFGTVSQISSDRLITQVAMSTTQGTVKTQIAEPLLIQVRDGNQNPISGWPLYYYISEGQNGAALTSPPTITNPIRAEAEWGKIEPKGCIIAALEHHKASRGKYIEFSSGSAQTGYVEIKFYVSESGDYYFWGRGVATSYWQQILWFHLDEPYPSNFDNNDMWRLLGPSTYSSDGYDFKWAPITMGESQVIFHRQLGVGEHTIRIYKGHNGVKLDKLLITKNSGYMPAGVDTVRTLFTDEDGYPSVPPKVTLGSKAGVNTVSARAFGSDQIFQWNILGLAAAPTTITPLGATMDQSGIARDTLAQDFEVTLTDPDGNVTPDVPVTWSVVQGDGRFLSNGAQTVVVNTDASGKAKARLVLGIMDSLNVVNATFSGYTGSLYQFIGRVTAGLIKTIQVISPVKAKHYIEDVLPNHVKVKILDDKSDAVANVPVNFEVAQGDAHTGLRQPKMTAADGTVSDTLFYGTTSSVVKIRARVSTQSQIIFTDSVYYKATKIRMYAGNNGIALLSDTLGSRMKVQIQDMYNRPVSGHPVKFRTRTPRDHGWKFPGDLDSVTVLTNYNGVAGTNIQAGIVHGEYKDLVEAHANDGFYKLNALPSGKSPIKFTLIAKSTASRLEKVSQDSLEGIVTEKLNSAIVVRMVDKDGQPVVGQPVHFEITAGGGHFEGMTPDSTHATVSTFGDGLAGIEYYLGETAGEYNNIIKVWATNGQTVLYPPEGIYYRFTAKASTADSLAILPPQMVSGTVGKNLAQSNRVKVFDSAKNGVPNVSVTFSVLNGGGTLAGSTDTTVTVKTQSSEGIGSVLWKLGIKAGTNNNVLEARAYNGIHELKGSPVLFYGSGISDMVDPDTSSIETSGSLVASGVDTCWITVTLRDKYGNPVSGKEVNIKVTGGTNYYDSKIGPTDLNGQAVGHLISPHSGEKVIEATVAVDNITLSENGVVNFDPNNAARIQPIFGSGQIGNVGTISKDSLAVRVTDVLGNPVANKRVYFQLTSTRGGRLLRSDDLSDVNGIACTYIIYGEETGEYTVEAIANTQLGEPLDGSPCLFMNTAKIGKAVTMFMVSGNNQQGPAGQVLPEPMVLGVMDVDGQPVAGVAITYEVESGDGSIVSSTVTDEYGESSAYFRTGTESGATGWVKAYNLTLSGSPIRFSAKSTAGLASRLAKLSGDGQTGVVGQSLPNPMMVKVTDAHGNPVSGTKITFAVASGEASFQGNGSVSRTTDASGLASAMLDLGYETGAVTVEASGLYLENSPIIFNANITTVQPATLVPLTDLTRVVSTNNYLPGAIKVQVQDAYGNGVPDVSVYFTKDTGDGNVVDAVTKTVVGDQIIASDDHGMAQIQFRAGSSAGTARIRAVSGEFTLQFVIDIRQNASLPVLNKALISSLYTVNENDQINPLTVFLAADDADGNALHFMVEQVGAVSRPPTMLLITESALTARIRWVPGFDDAGEYTFIARVVDINGGYDEKEFDVEVVDSPQAPTISKRMPVSQDTSVHAGMEHRFWIEATDPDLDPLTYTWRLDNQPLGSNSSLLRWNIPTSLRDVHLVSVQVSDGTLNDNYIWRVEIIAPMKVELAEFYALFDAQTNAVELVWSSASELRNSGFHVYRSTKQDGPFEQITSDLIRSENAMNYRYTDGSVEPGLNYYYKLMDVDEQGRSGEHGPVMVQIPRPEAYVLYQNFPNPFNPVTTIRYEIPKRDQVKILIYNMRGQLVTTLVNAELDPGYYESEWDGRNAQGHDVSTGLYIYRLQSSRKVITKRMVKMK
ncbi:Ig-like domain-containing protein [bacterium]|nr:Ig-like domain-containing protein [bacterium]